MRPEENDILLSYAIDSRCESSGNVWLLDKFGDYKIMTQEGLIVKAEYLDKTYISSKYGRLEKRSSFCLERLMSRALPVINKFDKGGLGHSQIMAVTNALSHPVSVIIGGPGTGKTTTALSIVKCYRNTRVIGLSPTGKGASRLGEVTGCTAFTIHRAINRANNDRLSFSDYDLVLIDECGMLSIDVLEMFITVIYRHKSMARIVFMGDSGQLPSIGPGKVLSEISSMAPTVELDLTYRYADADIGHACKLAKDGSLHDESTSVYSLSSGGFNEAMQAYSIMCRTFGTRESRLITYHNADVWEFNRTFLSFRKRDELIPVVCTENNYRYEVFNGQTGLLNRSGGYIEFGDKVVDANHINWSIAFASTCHRAQGGQWDGVVVWIPSSRFVSREWLHTALSRASSRLSVIVRDFAVTEKSIRTRKPALNRISLLRAFTEKKKESKALWV